MKIGFFSWLLIELESVAIASFYIVLSGGKSLFQYVDISIILSDGLGILGSRVLL